jgi:hypothetical protein
MTVVSFQDYTPPARFDSVPWTDAQIEESDAVDGTWTVIDTVPLTVIDADPANPALQSFTTTLGTAPDLWYRVSFLDGASGISEPTLPALNSTAGQPYASVSELARILKIRTPSAAQTAAMGRVLRIAAQEINDEIDLSDSTALTGFQLDEVEQVNLDRAADLWNHTEAVTGLTGLLGDEGGIAMPGRYSWNRYALRLANLKDQWGLA